MALLTRRKFLQAGAVIAAGGAGAVAADATIIQPNDPRLMDMEIPLAGLPPAWDGIRIVQLSDFHYDPYFSVVPIRKAIEVVNRLQPDLVVLTGDFVSSPTIRGADRSKRAADAIDPCVDLLRQLRARLGLLAVLGNHDVNTDPERIVKALESVGIPVLRNRSMKLVREGAPLWFAGIDDALEGEPNLPLALQGIPSDDFVVLLAHEPDFAVLASQHPVNLQLSGHSHGGQVRLPWLGAPILPPLGRLYPLGWYQVDDLMLYTNPGIGTVVLPIRFNCPPEISLITLHAGRPKRRKG